MRMHNPDNPGLRPITSRDIARRLGVSQPTVSRVLSGAPGYQYSAETRKRILDEAERMGYRPHAVARSLRERRTRVVGFHSWYGHLDARNAFLAEIIGSLQRSCRESDHFLMLHNFAPGTPVGDMLGELTCGRIDALVVHTCDDDPLTERLAACALPTVAVADRVTGLPSVVCDDHGGIAEAVRHLGERGHTRIAFIHPDVKLESAEARLGSYLREMDAHGWEPLCVPISYEEAAPALDVLRTADPRPTAVCCWNDVTALSLIRACMRSGVRVPEDLAVVGFDGLVDRRILARDLTTVDARWSEVTRVALDILHAMVRGEQVPSVTTLPTQLRVGETS